ncbi:MAG: SEC-C domain-containing protein, partial [Chloroflexi bacterium]|nr:SEC-C domain-containing protein [Chloroflexota bacterium]
FTGRLMFGRRYSEGLHQAIEAKEGLRIQRESVTLATITLQNYFRMYKKLAGMTGTAATEAEEFHKIYKLDVVVIPTNKPMVRTDYSDQVFKTEEAKYRAVVREIEGLHEIDRPVLVGTVSIEKSEHLSWMLQQRGIPHQVLNAKYHEREAAIIAEAGQPGAVTIATNMAGRGTDIVLGAGVTDKGGLHIIGTERHEARRIDNQLRGRSGRQGDPGSSRFYVSLEDDIMRRFGGDRIKGFMDWAGLDEDVPIEHGIVSKSLESAQTKVEGYNFDIRKHLVDYDDVVNKHRDVIYSERKKILGGADLKSNIIEMVMDHVEATVSAYLVDEHGDDWDTAGLVQALSRVMPIPADVTPTSLAQMAKEEVSEKLTSLAESLYEQKEQQIGSNDMRILERLVMLRIIDNLWIEHLTAMDDMREGISLRAVGQSDPLVAYKKEAHAMFESLSTNIQRDIVNTIYNVSISREPVPQPAKPLRTNRDAANGAPQARRAAAGKAGAPTGKKIGRNDPCPCGSGKKYKKCHGAAA